MLVAVLLCYCVYVCTACSTSEHCLLLLAAVVLTPRVALVDDYPFFPVACQLASPRGDYPAPRRGALYVCVQNALFCTFTCPARRAVGRFSRTRLQGTQGTRVYTAAQVWVPAGLRGTRSGRSTWHDLVDTHGIAFRRDTVNQARGTPPKCYFCSFFHLCCCF